MNKLHALSVYYDMFTSSYRIRKTSVNDIFGNVYYYNFKTGEWTLIEDVNLSDKNYRVDSEEKANDVLKTLQ